MLISPLGWKQKRDLNAIRGGKFGIPMHIHGVFFRVLERNGMEAIEQFTRDTVLVGPKESVTIGFVPEHRGIWLTHCHIQEHAGAGMMTTIEVKN